VPAGGINWVFHGEPLAVSRNRDLTRRLEPLLPAERLDAYAQATGIDLRRLPSAAVVGFDLGTLYLAETGEDLSPAAEAFAERLVAGVDVKRTHPRLTRISGVIGQTPQSMLSFDGKLLAVAVGDPTTVRIVEAFAHGKLKRTRRVLEGAALRSFRNFGSGAPLRFLAPGPFEGPWMYGAAGLLAVASGLGIAARPVAPDSLEVTIAIDGPWTAENIDPVVKLRHAWEALALSSTGRLFGLHEPSSPPTLSASEKRVELFGELRVSPIVDGLKAAVSADVWEMLDLEPTSAHDEGAQERTSASGPEIGPGTSPQSTHESLGREAR